MDNTDFRNDLIRVFGNNSQHVKFFDQIEFELQILKDYAEQNNPQTILIEETKRLNEITEFTKKAELWDFYASSPQTALMLGSDLDPNDNTIDWVEESTKLANDIMERNKT